jgi:hypothetical protein
MLVSAAAVARHGVGLAGGAPVRAARLWRLEDLTRAAALVSELRDTTQHVSTSAGLL